MKVWEDPFGRDFQRTKARMLHGFADGARVVKRYQSAFGVDAPLWVVSQYILNYRLMLHVSGPRRWTDGAYYLGVLRALDAALGL